MDKSELFELRRSGKSYAEIGRVAGMTRQNAQQILSPPAEIRRFIIGKQSGLCLDCGINCVRGGHIHHISVGHESFEDYSDILNLVLLCPSCHRRRHGGMRGNRLCPDCGHNWPEAIGEYVTSVDCPACETVKMRGWNETNPA
jgi:hypothetical protein